MSNQLRYLLHGNLEKYDDVTTSLYVTAEESTVWQKIGQQILQIRGEDWRLIDPLLVKHITLAKRQVLGIELLQSEAVVNLIRELGVDCVDGSLLEQSERYELLRYISQRPNNQELWKALRLHETVTGELVDIQAGKMYLENLDFPLDQDLEEYIVLIRQNHQEINQEWIPLWTADRAIATILGLTHPEKYSKLIFNAIEHLSTSEKDQWESELKNVDWLVDVDGKAIKPRDVLRLPKHLVVYQQVVCSLDNTKYTDAVLPSWVHTHEVYHWIKQKLFTTWNVQTIIEKIFRYPHRTLTHWCNFCPVILDALQELDISKNSTLEILLSTETWLVVNDQLITPKQVIEISHKPIDQHLSTLVEISAGKYAELSMLSENIQNHDSLKIVKNFFSKWTEDDVVEFILDQHQPHLYINITLDALSNLLKKSGVRLSEHNIQNLKTKAWLVDIDGNGIYPENVLHYPSIKIEIEELLLQVSSSFISSSQLSPIIRNHETCWKWLTQELFLIKDKALSQVGTLLNEADEYQLGEFELDEFPLDEILQVFNQLDPNFLPVWGFFQIDQKEFKKYLLPNLSGKLDEEKLIKILQNLVQLNTQPEESTINVFNLYLRLAVNYEDFSQDFLGKICLLNNYQQWQTCDKLTWGNLENIDGNYVLNSVQAEIMQSYLNQLQRLDSSTILQIPVKSVDQTNSDVLQKYFSPWEQHCPTEPMGALLSLLCSNEGSVKDRVHLYLGKRDLGLLYQRLFEDQPIESRAFLIEVGQVSDRTREVQSIMGFTFKATLVNHENPPHLFVSKLAPDVKKLELLPIDPLRFTSSTLIDILRKSAEILLREVYQVTPVSLNQIWQNLRESDQLDIQVAKTVLLESAPYIMRMLGVHQRIPAIKQLLTSWDNCHNQRAELKQQNRNVEKIDQEIDQLIFQLSDLLENQSSTSEDIREKLLEAVRAKISLYGYQLQSIPFELFQNADDAVVEWMEMSSKAQLDERRTEFIITFDQKKIQFIHSGRPIGCFQHPEHPDKQYRDRGFDRDLQKMLNFNISDKGEGVTGKFGLGFKSVYLASERPYVLSKNLGFTVEGGLIPSRLNPEKASELRNISKRYTGLTDATIVELNLEEDISCEDLLQDFQTVVNILLIFSKKIKTCNFFNHHHSEISLSWNPSTVTNLSGVEIGKYPNIDNAQASTLLCLKTGEPTKATLVLGIFERNGRLYNALPDNTSTFWVTAPTKEKIFVNFILNANFEITTGRESLVKSSVFNRELAKCIGNKLGEVLCELFHASEHNWEGLVEAFGFTSVDKYEFWSFLWENLAVHWQKKDLSEGLDIIRCMLTGDLAMGHLSTRCQSLPTGLYGSYRQLVSLHQINYQVRGKLSEQSTFLQVANWTGFKQAYQDNLIIDHKWEEVRKLLGNDFVKQHYTVSDLRLLDALRNEIGNSQSVDPFLARYIGSLITKEFVNNLSIAAEVTEIQAFLETVHFMSQSGTYVVCQQLLTSNSNALEEKLLVDFAPKNRILHIDYQHSALEFFYACRSRRNRIFPDEIIQWALQATTEEQHKAVYAYLLSGEQRESIAPNLYSYREHSWFANDKRIKDILEYMVLIVTEREDNLLSVSRDDLQKDKDDTDDYNPFLEIHTSCTRDDFSFERSPEEIAAFALQLQAGLNRQHSSWKGYIYHFTHIENAVSIIRSQQLLARNFCHNFKDSAGARVIDQTSNNVKDFARFYFRPQTPTQWHNQGLGKRRGNIYALCPVPIFFCFDLRRVLETQGSKCGVSSGNLAASGSHYGNSTTFLEQCFDFNHVYSTLQQLGRETFLRASQQEFIIYHDLDLTQLNLEDIRIICRTTQDKDTLLKLIGTDSIYANRVLKEREVVNEGSVFYQDNPCVSIKDNGNFIDIQIDNYDRYGNISGELILSFTEQLPTNRQIIAPFADISRISLGETINVNASRHIQLQYNPNTYINVRFKEIGQEWLIYTNEP